MSNTYKSIFRPSLIIALGGGAAVGWFTHTRLAAPPIALAAPVALTSPRPGSSPLSIPIQSLDERIQPTEARLKNTQASYTDLLRERDQLARTNSALDDARLKAETDKARAEQNSDFMAGIASKLASEGQLQVPQTVAEAAVFAGQLHRTAMNFHAKWGDKAPAEGTPEFTAYHKEMDALATDAATMMKSFGTYSMDDIVKKPASVAQFQSLQFYGALQLNDSQWQQLDGMLNRYYAEGFNLKLEGASRPEAGVDVWQQQRTALSQRAFNEIQTTLTPQQRADFERLYKTDFLWKISIGGL